MKSNYNDVLIHHESKGDYQANTAGSSYYGLGQFSEKSATPYLKQMGHTWNDYLSNPDIQRNVLDIETDANNKMMASYGDKDITDLDRWTAHNLGYGNWRKIQRGQTGDANLLKAVHNQAGSPQDVDAYMAQYGAMFGGMPTASQSDQGLMPVAAPTEKRGKSVAEMMAGLGNVAKPKHKPAMPTQVVVNDLSGFTGFRKD